MFLFKQRWKKKILEEKDNFCDKLAEIWFKYCLQHIKYDLKIKAFQSKFKIKKKIAEKDAFDIYEKEIKKWKWVKYSWCLKVFFFIKFLKKIVLKRI